MQKIELEIFALSKSVSQYQGGNETFIVVLGEAHSNRRLPITIGQSEAQSIALILENYSVQRPLTHDLIKNICTSFHLNLREVIIAEVREAIFYSKLIFESNGVEYEIDSRTSDALALALRFSCPIYSYEEVLRDVWIEDAHIEQASTGSTKHKFENALSKYNTHELNTMLQEALEKEDYEAAAKIRDEIDKRG